MTYSPSPRLRTVRFISAALLIPALAAYMFSLYGSSRALPLQLCALVLVCAEVYILIRYRFTRITYTLKPKSFSDEDIYGNDITSMPTRSVDFTVKKAQGQREGAVECILSLDLLSDMIELSPDDTLKEVRSLHKNASLYIYTVSIGKCARQALIFDDDGAQYCIITELSEEMIDYLRIVVAKNKASAGSDFI